MLTEHVFLEPKYNILVTGGAGFIGSNICRTLLNNGNKVTILDNLATGRLSNLKDIVNHPNLNFIQGDILDFDLCSKVCKGIHYVLHQAALGSVPRSINDPLACNAVNISGFLNMLMASRDAKVKRFIYAASSSTYGDLDTLPKVETNIGKPLTPYAVTKYVNELYAEVFNKLYGLETIGLRYFNVFGPYQDPNGVYAAVIPKFVLALIKHKSPTIHGNGSHSRDFTYIDNVVDANIRSILVDNPEAVNTVYNIAVGERTDLNCLMTTLKDYLSEYDSAIQSVKVLYDKERIGDIPHSQASIQKARDLLDYSPRYTIKAGLKKTVQWYWENQDFNEVGA